MRGKDGYRETWPPYFAWQASGAVFDIVELGVTKRDEVAWALLRSGSEQGFAEMPERLLRLTLGLRKEDAIG